MARAKSVNLDKYIDALTGLEQSTPQALKMVVYEGAGTIADAVRSEIEGIPLGKQYMINPLQRTGLLEGLGISKIKESGGVVHAKIGMDGYNHYHTKTYPGGQPNAMIARSLISGTSFSPKYDFVSKAINKARAQAEEKMKAEYERLVKKKMGE